MVSSNASEALYEQVQRMSTRGYFSHWFTRLCLYGAIAAAALNIIVVFILSRTPTLSNFIVRAMLVTDILLLATQTMTVLPAESLIRQVDSLSDQERWDLLNVLQRTFVACVPILEVTRTLTHWFALALVVEHLMALKELRIQHKLSKDNKPATFVFTIVFLAALLHMTLYFKFTRKHIYSAPPDRNKVCIEGWYLHGFMQGYNEFGIWLIMRYSCLLANIVAFFLAILAACAHDPTHQTPELEPLHPEPSVFVLDFLYILTHCSVAVLQLIDFVGELSEPVVAYVAQLPHTICILIPTEFFTRPMAGEDLVFYSFMLSVSFALIKAPILLVSSTDIQRLIRRGCVTVSKMRKRLKRERVGFSLESTIIRKSYTPRRLPGNLTAAPDSVIFINSTSKGACIVASV